MVVFLARQLSTNGFATDRFRSVAMPVAVMAVFQVIYLKQPDFGSTVILGVLTLGMLYMGGVRLRYLAAVMALCAPVIVQLVREPYRLTRIVAFLDPWKDPTGSGFQLVQSFIAFGRGGLTGVGLGQSRQKLDFLPEVHTDFIFSLVGEELGFAVAVLVVMLFAVVFWRGVRIAERAEDPFSRHLAYGLSMMIALQALVNFCVVTGLLPTKGLPLPFLSYGGSSLFINLAAVGILLNLSRPVRLPEPTKDDLTELLRKKKARRAVYGVVR
jgi:cell division protein FtsW